MVRLRKLLSDLGETFWLVPALLVLAGVLAALGASSSTAAAGCRAG